MVKIYLATSLDAIKFVEYKGHMPDFLNKVTIVPNNNLDNIFAKNIKSYLNQIWQNQQETQTLTEKLYYQNSYQAKFACSKFIQTQIIKQFYPQFIPLGMIQICL